MNAKILHAAMFCPAPEGWWGLPIFLWGPPGIGKTHFIKDAAANTGMEYERLSPGERGEGQFGCVPVPREDGFLHYPAPAWSERFSKSGGVIFVDELNTAPPALQAPLLGLVQLRALGSFSFSKRTRVIAAANETRDAAGGWDLAPALANRFGHFDFEGMDADSWGVALLGDFKNLNETLTSVEALKEEERVMEAWPGAMAIAAGLVTAFIRKRPELLHKQPENAAASASKAWPSRRSVHYATVALASARVHQLSEIDTDTFMSGFVGLPWVQEFRHWLVNMDLPDPADVLDGKVKWKHDPRRLDRTIAVLASCAALVVPEKAKDRKKRANTCWQLIGSVLDDSADCAVPAARAMVKAQPTLVAPVSDFPAWEKIGARLHPIMSMAGALAR